MSRSLQIYTYITSNIHIYHFNLEFDITITMDAEKQVNRAELYTDQITSTRVITKQIITISKTEEHCEDFNAFLKVGNQLHAFWSQS